MVKLKYTFMHKHASEDDPRYSTGFGVQHHPLTKSAFILITECGNARAKATGSNISSWIQKYSVNNPDPSCQKGSVYSIRLSN